MYLEFIKILKFKSKLNNSNLMNTCGFNLDFLKVIAEIFINYN